MTAIPASSYGGIIWVVGYATKRVPSIVWYSLGAMFFNRGLGQNFVELGPSNEREAVLEQHTVEEIALVAGE